MRTRTIWYVISALSMLFCIAIPVKSQSIEELKRQKEIERNPLLKYESVFSFNNGVAIAYNDGYYGLVNEEGEVIEDFKYNQLDYLGNFLYRGRKNGQYGCIDTYGRDVVPFYYDSLGEFKSGIAKVCRGGYYGFVSIGGKEVIPCIYSSIGETDSKGRIKVIRQGKTGYMDTNGNELVSCSYDQISRFSSDGFAWVSKGKFYGLYNTNSHSELIPCIYTAVQIQVDTVRKKANFTQAPYMGKDNILFVSDGAKWGVINPTGKVVSSCQWDYISYFSNSKAWVINNGKFGILTSDGVMVQPCNIEEVQFKNDKEVFSFSESSCVPDFKTRQPYIKVSGKWGLLNIDGTSLVPMSYDSLGVYHCGLMVVKKDDKYGFIDEDGNIKVNLTYASAMDFSENIAVVKKVNDKKFYFIDTNNKELFNHKADIVEPFSGGKCLITKNGKHYFLDTNGKKVKEEHSTKDTSSYNGTNNLGRRSFQTSSIGNTQSTTQPTNRQGTQQKTTKSNKEGDNLLKRALNNVMRNSRMNVSTNRSRTVKYKQ